MRLTADLLQRAVGCSAEVAARVAEPLAAACAFYAIDTPDRLAHFLAQVGHESMSFRYQTEIWGPTAAQRRYEGRADLGNTQPGDGERFKGHGYIQTTGRFNHARVRDRLRERFPQIDVPDFEAEPERLAEVQWACLSACDYWDDRGLNALADRGDFFGITKRVNGGYNGVDDRRARLERAQRVLPPEPQPAPEIAAALHPAPAAAIPEPIEPSKESTMPLPVAPLLLGLASSLIDVFSPLAREKLTKEMARHTDNPEVAGQIAGGIIESAKALTGQPDPVKAVVAVQAEPELVQQVEVDALATLERMAPLLDKLAQWDRQAWDAEEASRDAASRRAATDANDQDVFLTRSIVAIAVGLLVFLVVLVAVLVWLKASESTIGTVMGLLAMATGVAFGEFKTRYQHRYGSSRGSSSKDVVIGELSRRGGKA